MNNLERYIARYWELNFPDKLNLEKIFFEITDDFIDKMDYKNLEKLLVKFNDSFDKFKRLLSSVSKDEILKQYNLFLKNWFITYLLVFYNVLVHSNLVTESLKSFELFL